mmetsp:Transcript_15296/g.12994  ORF Transcript_15296/g.12994 Transcript_15296/m.12994 type:complete len:122 (+) Transcript_15296:465-830(+)
MPEVIKKAVDSDFEGKPKTVKNLLNFFENLSKTNDANKKNQREKKVYKSALKTFDSALGSKNAEPATIIPACNAFGTMVESKLIQPSDSSAADDKAEDDNKGGAFGFKKADKDATSDKIIQ